MRRLLGYVVMLTILTGGSRAFAEDEKPSVERILYSSFLTIERFGVIQVQLSGSAEKIGLAKEGLADYLRLRFKNSFAKIDYKEQRNFGEQFASGKADKLGVIWATVWTVGDDFPIAYHVELTAGNLSQVDQYRNATLGYGAKKNVPDAVRESISELMNGLAIAFFKARGEL